MDKSDMKPVERQLLIIARLLAKLVLASTLQAGASQQEQIGLLNSLGLENDEIAGILGTSAGSVRRALSRLRKQTP